MSNLILYNYDLDEGCYRVRLLLSILKLPYEAIAIDMEPGREHQQPHMLALNPTGSLPILRDGDLTLFGTEAILAYLTRAYDKTGQWLPLDPVEFGQIQQWLGFSQGHLHHAVQARHQALFTPEGATTGDRAAARRAFRIMDDHMTLQQIDGAEFFVGETPTIADIALVASFALSRDFGQDHDEFPALRRWLRRVRKLGGFMTMPGIPDYH
ncbi:glutathione S-transferase family protein [Peteryoungia desertarenae]|uniref:Glutathione S-transferase family protein n=1 Tax=Peteryoungia desertarenae TaxID=1813451 RepID=A0ABX6QIJ5_9HYPH|nr:glutathione S-transferase family protein [Peteryoungia desertarenae]QLF68388.1 glutathione S-transferase family protein [Peteryoungia desertarenae]